MYADIAWVAWQDCAGAILLSSDNAVEVTMEVSLPKS